MNLERDLQINAQQLELEKGRGSKEFFWEAAAAITFPITFVCSIKSNNPPGRLLWLFRFSSLGEFISNLPTNYLKVHMIQKISQCLSLNLIKRNGFKVILKT
ncbi:hypothetical protein BpHYR1_021340 [Brachionus plicatilis]|uniref:Uncharacterized protein n=1 Tax=Brachionus plicatilis TaxID=10195 RepID=A0A3M7QAQ1_BRAPC|nr:hypothetical protein BpHYR1_021340 [Brachionus plicatilis]